MFFGGGDFINCFICPQTNLSGNFLWLCIFELRHRVFLYSLSWPQSCDLLRGLPSTRSTTYSTKPPLCFKTIFVAWENWPWRARFQGLYSTPSQGRVAHGRVHTSGRQKLESSHGSLPSKCASYRHTPKLSTTCKQNKSTQSRAEETNLWRVPERHRSSWSLQNEGVVLAT